MRATQKHGWDGLSLGVCYYPEHWDKSLWRDDLRRMKAVGLFTVRIAEFAWTMLEPREGVFDFALFDAFLDLAEAEGMKVIFCTPTATPPAWLTEKYPQVLNCRIDGAPYRHGMRRHYNYNAPIYREKCAIVVERIAEHYAKRPCIVGWQIDNELNCIFRNAVFFYCIAHYPDKAFVRVDSIASAAQDTYISGFKAECCCINGNVGSRFKDDTDNSERNADFLNNKTVRKLFSANYLIDRIFQLHDLSDTLAHSGDTRFGQSKPVCHSLGHSVNFRIFDITLVFLYNKVFVLFK